MTDIERISKKITEEKDNLIARAFTYQISSLLLTNGIVPIMTEYSFNDLKTITDSDRYELVYELGVMFDSLDTTEHDKQIRAEVIAEISRELHLLYGNEYEKKIRTDEQDRILSIVSRCIAHNVYNVSEGIALLNEIKEELKEE